MKRLLPFFILCIACGGQDYFLGAIRKDVTRGLIAYWPLDGNATDRIAGMNGSATGTITESAGRISRSMDFEGSTDYYTVTDVAALQGTGSHSVSTWVKLDLLPTEDSGTAKFIFSKGGGGFGLAIACDDSAGNNVWFAAAVTTVPSTVQYNAGDTAGNFAVKEWQHICAIYDSTGPNVKVYVNGVLADTETTGTVLRHSGNTFIGSSGTPDRWLNGFLDDLRLYNVALTPDEVMILYMRGL